MIELKRVTNSKTGELEESYILSDFYLSREFTDGELRLLIDSLLFSQHIPYSRCGSWCKSTFICIPAATAGRCSGSVGR